MCHKRRLIESAGLFCLFFGIWGCSANVELNYALVRPHPLVAVDNVCAWPELTSLADGTIVAVVHNQPSHLLTPGDVDCWASEDGGRSWEKRGTPAPRDDENAARGHMSIGTAENGDLIVITTGWSGPFEEKNRGHITPTWVSRSDDGGYTWSIDKDGFPKAPDGQSAVPFGNIISGDGGVLLVSAYRAGTTYVYRSDDDGRTWKEPAAIDTERATNETALFHLGGGRLLAAARTDSQSRRVVGLDLYASEDNGQSWSLYREQITGPQQHPGHLMRLSDGPILLSYGNREFSNAYVPQEKITSQSRGVDVRFSDDEGSTWSEPFRVVDFEADGGYPSSIQLADGRILTAYYARRIAGHNKYHMGVVLWDTELTTHR